MGNVLLLETEKNALFKKHVLNTKLFKMIFTRNQNTEFQDFKNGPKFSETFCWNKNFSCDILYSWNKNFANFKGLKESKADLAFLLKSQALHLIHLFSL